MFTRPPLLALKHGTEGPFFDWLMELGLESFIDRYPLRTLTEWGWLVPQFRYVFSNEFFLDWETFPNLGEAPKPQHEVESLLWDSNWFVDDESEPSWFLHPFFHPTNTAGRVLHENGTPVSTIEVPAPFAHPRNRTIFPYADYFYHWQGYALVDVIQHADCIAPILNTPDVVKRAEGIARIAEHVKQYDPTDVLRAPNGWAGLAEPMTWLSHYRCFVRAVDSSQLEWNESFARRRRGAKALAQHLGFTADDLAEAIRDRLLVLADNWRSEIKREKHWARRPYEMLRLDILDAVVWLCYLSDRTFEDYLKEWQYSDRGRARWAELKEILPFEWFHNREKFLLLTPHYLKTFNEVAGDSEKLVDNALEKRVDNLRLTNEPFGSFLSAFRLMHEQLSTKHDSETVYDFRELRPLDGYLLLAIRCEAILRYSLEHGAGLPSSGHQLTNYIAELATARGLSSAAIAAFKQAHPKIGKLHTTPPDGPIKPIMALQTGLPPREDYLVKSFLCALVARNYFAHHYYFDNSLWRTEESGYLLSGILTTVLWLAPGPMETSPGEEELNPSE